MAVHLTPRMVLQRAIRKISRKQYQPTKVRRMYVGMKAAKKIRNPEAYEAAKQFNVVNGLNNSQWKARRVSGWNRSVKRKITMPKLNIPEVDND